MNDDVDLTREEQERLRALPRERIPARDLEERTVRALRASRVLRPRSPWRWARVGLAAAAGLVIFAGGALYGEWRAAGHVRSEAGAAERVRTAGSAYVAALGDLARGEARADSADADAGRAAALETLHRAAGEVVLLTPEDRIAGSILVAFDEAGKQAQSEGNRVRRIVWF